VAIFLAVALVATLDFMVGLALLYYDAVMT
jgi:hypothetical protein